MSDIETETLTGSGGEALPQAEGVKPEVAEKVDAAPEGSEDKKDDQEEDNKRKERAKNRTRDYIERLKRENAELRASQVRPQAQQRDEPTLADFNFDQEAFVRDTVERRLQMERELSQSQEAERRAYEVALTYQERVNEFTDAHPDFEDVVRGIPAQFLPGELQEAILAHERGPEIAYHIALNDDDLFQLASIRPELMGAAVDRLAKRLAAPQQKPSAQPKPTTKAPPPPATVSGRAPTETPPEKLTDAEWYAREVEREKASRRG